MWNKIWNIRWVYNQHQWTVQLASRLMKEHVRKNRNRKWTRLKQVYGDAEIKHFTNHLKIIIKRWSLECDIKHIYTEWSEVPHGSSKSLHVCENVKIKCRWSSPQPLTVNSTQGFIGIENKRFSLCKYSCGSYCNYVSTFKALSHDWKYANEYANKLC